ncbi:MAG: hypothetical protein IJX11_09960 [Bacteroidales bacterium]|nr:hypothetical protein [Bacteroidales bacterium]MBQ9169069.1 hypothetical protein [Oscillospiraceae bacterium]
MNVIQRLSKVNKYIRQFSVDGIRPVVVTRSGDAVTKLARLAGDQLLVARPELSVDGDVDCMRPRVTLAFFAIAKIDGPSLTEEVENNTYDRLEVLIDKILAQFAEDITGAECPLLRGMDLVAVDVVPESGIFGGWSGYSIEISLE